MSPEGGDELHVQKLDSLPKDTDVWTRPANVKIEAGHVLLPVAGVYWDSPVRQFLPSEGETI